eukprot:131123_1
MSTFTLLHTPIWDVILSYLEWSDMKLILCDDCYPLNLDIFTSDLILLSFCKRYFFINSLNILSSLSLSMPFKIYIISNLISTLYPKYKCYYLSICSLSNEKQTLLFITALCFRHLMDIFLTRNFDKNLTANNYENNRMWQYFHKYEYFRIFFTKIILSRPYSVLYTLEHFEHGNKYNCDMEVCSYSSIICNYSSEQDLLRQYDKINLSPMCPFKCAWRIGHAGRRFQQGYGFCIFSSDNNDDTFFYAQSGDDDKNYSSYWLQSTGDDFIKYNKDTPLDDFIHSFDSSYLHIKYGESYLNYFKKCFLHFPNFYYGNKVGINGIKWIIKYWLNESNIGDGIVDLIIEYYSGTLWDGSFDGYCSATGNNLPHIHCFEFYYPLIETLHCGCVYCSDISNNCFLLNSSYPEVRVTLNKIFTNNHQCRDILFDKFQQKISKAVRNIINYIHKHGIDNVWKCMELMDRMRMDINKDNNMRRSKVLKQSIERCIRRIINSLLPLQYIKIIKSKYLQTTNQYPMEYRFMIKKENKKHDISMSNGKPRLWPPLYLMIGRIWINVIIECLKFDLLSIKPTSDQRKNISIMKLNKKLKHYGLLVKRNVAESILCNMIHSF